MAGFVCDGCVVRWYNIDMEKQMVGRAELKLEEAVKAFRYDFRGKIVFDIGSSTGGFTELALKLGAKKVYAIEKGTRQMKAPLRYDARICLLEKTDVFDVIVSKQRPTITERWVVVLGCGGVAELEGKVDTVLADVSFISLTRVLAHAKKDIAGRGTDYLVMLKPQFEAYPDQLVKGVVKNEKMRREIIKRFEMWLGKNGFVIVNKRDNDTVGKVGGNRERFYWLKNGGFGTKNERKSLH